MRQYKTILLCMSSAEELDQWIQLVFRMATPTATLHLCGIITIPADQNLSEGTIAARELRQALDAAAKAHDAIHDEVKVHVDYHPAAAVLDDVAALQADLLLVDWAGPQSLTGGTNTDDMLQRARCDVVLLERADWSDAGTVLLALRGGPNLSLGVALAKALAHDEPITLFHAADREQDNFPAMNALAKREGQIERIVTATSGIANGIIREARFHKAIILGATFRLPEASASSASPLVEEIHNRTHTPLALVRAAHPEAIPFHVPDVVTTPEADLSNRVDRWFAQSTYHADEFADLRYLMTLKEKQGVTISVGLPALNEGETVGKVISTLKMALMDEVPLVDEIVLIDSDSTDDTRSIARDLGIPVYIHQQILANEVGARRGKGEALWKSLHVLNGDIIAWVDTDITNIHPRFIYGLLGPMLKNTHVQYVKGYYQRPIKVGDKMQASGGGRVTELVARPLLNLFYPELSGIIQPLSGEYAGRRSILERVPFFSGYGVETGLLIDILDRAGLDAIAQADLENRVHHNQPLIGLSKMAFAILQVFISRLESRYSFELLDKANRSMKTIIHEPERFALEINDIADVERPPIIKLPAYQARRAAVK